MRGCALPSCIPPSLSYPFRYSWMPDCFISWFCKKRYFRISIIILFEIHCEPCSILLPWTVFAGSYGACTYLPTAKSTNNVIALISATFFQCHNQTSSPFLQSCIFWFSTAVKFEFAFSAMLLFVVITVIVCLAPTTNAQYCGKSSTLGARDAQCKSDQRCGSDGYCCKADVVPGSKCKDNAGCAGGCYCSRGVCLNITEAIRQGKERPPKEDQCDNDSECPGGCWCNQQSECIDISNFRPVPSTRRRPPKPEPEPQKKQPEQGEASEEIFSLYHLCTCFGLISSYEASTLFTQQSKIISCKSCTELLL